MEIKISGTPEEIAALVQTLGLSEKPVTIEAPQIAAGTISVEHLRSKKDSPLDVPFLLTKKIKLLCAERNLSFADLEQACGLGSRTIYRWDKSSPSMDKIQRVASFFGVSIDSLLCEQESSVDAGNAGIQGERQMWDYAKLRGRIRESGITQEEIGRKIGLTPTTFSLKLNNKAEFRHSEIEGLCLVLDIPIAEIPAYFFTHVIE